MRQAKPAPDLLLVGAAQLGVPPDGAWYVGDATWDMQAAAAAGMIGIAVRTGAATRQRLELAGASRVVTDLVEVAELLP